MYMMQLTLRGIRTCWTLTSEPTGVQGMQDMSINAAPQDCARVMPDTLRLKLAWQQHFLEEDWVLELYSTKDSMPKACQQGAGPSARLCNVDRHAIFSPTSYFQTEKRQLGNAHRLS